MWPTLSQVVALLEHLQPLQFDWATRTAGELMNYDLQSTANILIAGGHSTVQLCNLALCQADVQVDSSESAGRACKFMSRS